MSSKRLATNNNQLPEGYKKTEIGVIPEDWEVCYIQDLVEKGILEKPLDGNHGNIHPKSKDFVPFGIPFIMSNNVQNGLIDTENCHFIRKEQADKLQKGFSFVGDVLLTHKGTVGNVAIVSNIPTEYIMLTPQVTYYRVKEHNRLTNNFIKFYFESTQFQTKLEHLSEGGTRAYIGITNQRKLPFLLPPLPEQKAIAQTLSDVDALTASLDKLIAKKRNIKTGTMQQLLTGKTRLPGLGGSWKTMLFLEIAWCRKERIDPRKSGTQEFCVELEHIESGTGRLLGNTQTGDQSSLKAVFQPGDVLFGKLRSYLQKYWIADREGVCSTEIWVLAANARLVISKFLYQVVTTEQFINAASNAYGTHMPRSDWNIVKNYKVAVPPLPEQKAIAKVLFDIDIDITALEKRRAKTQAIKQGMMQELLTGRTRLKIEHPDDPITKNSNG